ncbi:hypothetical protein [Priestia flexa]|nr:hypothetical protein [Priestia flexa]MBN8435714.1 hypothetical protein [Priestia flexa]MCA0968269.1 hypothetical protein [Priestia flexa]UZW65787.1 hypothetical protein OC195_17405 [Priestia flexa]
MTKINNKGSANQSNPKTQHQMVEMGEEITSGDNSKGNKRNKDQNSKTN